MTPKDFFTRIKDELQSFVWGATSNKLFGDAVYIVPEIPIQTIHRWANVCAFLIDDGAQIDPEHPGLLTQNFSITIFIQNIQSAFGEAAMIGGCRTADTSDGAGILDIEYSLLKQIIDIVQIISKAMLVEKSFPRVNFLNKNTPLIFRKFSGSILLGVY